MEKREVYVVWTNTDLSEGRGREYAMAYTKLEATARRLARRNYVQGTDCHVTKADLLWHDGEWYAPGPRVEPGTREDIEEQKRLDEEKRREALRDRAIERAKSLGLTDEEIRLMTGYM